SRSEQQLFAEADLVFGTSERLRARAAVHARAVHIVPSGVSLDRFETARDTERAQPADVASLERPVIGYVGGLHQWIDQELLAGVAQRMPHASFAMIGPAQGDISRLSRCPNVHLLGAKTHVEVPDYIKAF